MSNILKFTDKDNKEVGKMEYKNVTDYSCDLYIYGDITAEKMEDSDVCPEEIRDFLSEINDGQELHIHMNSGGGNVFAGIAIGNLLAKKKCRKVCHIDALCASIATVIACSCDEVIIPSNAQFMIHKPMTCFYLETLNADELQKEINTLNAIQESIVSTYMRKAKDGVTEEQLNEYMNNETWFTGKKACEIFDFTLEEAREMVACASNIFDTAKNIPAELKKEEEASKENEPDKAEEITFLKAQVEELTNKIKEREDRDARKNAILARIKK